MRGPSLRRWYRASGSYAPVLWLILAAFAFAGLAPEAPWSRTVLLLIQAVAAGVAWWTSGAQPRLRLAVVVGVAILAAVAIPTSHSGRGVIASALDGVLVIAIAVVIGRGVVEVGTVNRQSVVGAICVYVLLGMLFTAVYGVVAVADGDGFFAQGTDGTTATRLYYSFTTLTTVGYGDLTTAGSLGHTLSVGEALIGQLYLVTIVAVLVGRLGRARAS